MYLSQRINVCRSLFGTFYVESPIDSGAVLYGSQMICPDEFVFGVLDYLFAVGVWGWGFWILGLGRICGTNIH